MSQLCHKCDISTLSVTFLFFEFGIDFLINYFFINQFRDKKIIVQFQKIYFNFSKKHVIFEIAKNVTL